MVSLRVRHYSLECEVCSDEIVRWLPCFLQYKDKDLLNLWRQLKAKIPSFFEGIPIEPSLLHGDLWQGNASETKDCPGIMR